MLTWVQRLHKGGHVTEYYIYLLHYLGLYLVHYHHDSIWYPIITITITIITSGYHNVCRY